MGPTWGPRGTDRTQVGPMLAPWTLLSGSHNRSRTYSEIHPLHQNDQRKTHAHPPATTGNQSRDNGTKHYKKQQGPRHNINGIKGKIPDLENFLQSENSLI